MDDLIEDKREIMDIKNAEIRRLSLAAERMKQLLKRLRNLQDQHAVLVGIEHIEARLVDLKGRLHEE